MGFFFCVGGVTDMAMIWVKKAGASGTGESFSPSAFTYGFQDVSASNSGRTDDAVMHKNRVAKKIKLSLGWNGPNRAEVAKILNAFDPEYVDITFPNPRSETGNITKTFYTGDITAPVKIWTVNNKLYTSVTFDVVER